MRSIENLVFKGCGVLGTAYAGAIVALDEYGLFNDIQRVAGTSSGSITAALVGLRYTAKEIKDITHAIPFNSFGDHWDPLRILTHYGIYKGDAFLTWMKGIIKARTGDEDITFSGWKEKGFLELKVFATDLNTSTIQEFSTVTTPNAIVAECLRASMAVPFFFSAWQFPSGKPNNHLYVDGGIVYSYPITSFGDLTKTLGFFLQTDKPAEFDVKYNEILIFSRTLFHAITNAQDQDFGKNKEESDVTVKVHDQGISSLDLDITDDQRELLFAAGKEATIQYLQDHA